MKYAIESILELYFGVKMILKYWIHTKRYFKHTKMSTTWWLFK